MTTIEAPVATEGEHVIQASQNSASGEQLGALSTIEQELTDRFAPLHEVASAFTPERKGVRRTDHDHGMLNQLKWATEEITQDVLPQTMQFASRQRGFEVDVSLTGAYFANLTKLRDELRGRLAGSTVDSMLERVDVEVVDSFTRLLDSARAGSVRKGQAISGLDAVAWMTANYVASSEYPNVSRSLLANARERGYGPLFEGDEYDGLLKLPGWRAAVLVENVSPALQAARLESRPLTDDEKAPVLKALKIFGFNEREAESVLRASLSRRTKNKTPEQDATTSMLNVVNNLDAIDELATISPELPAKCFQLFGIRNFMRYETDDLVAQTDPIFTPDAVAVSATADWNGAFSDWGQEAKRLARRPYFVEAENPVDLARQFIKIRKAGIPVNEVLIGAHGTQTSIQLGRTQGESLDSELIEQSQGMRHLVEKGLIKAGCKVVLVSCNTGHEGAIGDQIAALPGIGKVQAPDFRALGVLGRSAAGDVLYKAKDSTPVDAATYSYPKQK